MRAEYLVHKSGAASEHSLFDNSSEHVGHFARFSFAFNELSIILLNITRNIRFDARKTKFVPTFKVRTIG